MSNINKVFLGGFVAAPPKKSEAYTRLRIVVNETFFSKSKNEKVKRPTFVDVNAYSNLGNFIAQNLNPGDTVFVEANFGNYENNEGITRTTVNVQKIMWTPKGSKEATEVSEE